MLLNHHMWQLFQLYLRAHKRALQLMQILNDFTAWQRIQSNLFGGMQLPTPTRFELRCVDKEC